MQFPIVTLIHIAPDLRDQSEKAFHLRQRLKRICSLALQLGISVKVIDDSMLVNGSNLDYIKKSLQHSLGIWWFGCMITKEKTHTLWNYIHRVSKFNPGYCAGWAHKSVYLVYIQLLATISGQSFTALEVFQKIDIGMCGKNSVWGLL
ncbi:hypothetical protein [Candidatus Uabimicrobium sp. HlEnr_7]|uniref:hypothetical protein n=1 Tax=Candidatus Uabimicrobium helgolandensis TaxID=3095367 RepID=UPI0035585566